MIDPFNLFTSVAACCGFERVNALVEKLLPLLHRWQNQVFVELFEADRLEQTFGVIRLTERSTQVG